MNINYIINLVHLFVFLHHGHHLILHLLKELAQLARDIAQAGFWQSKEIDIMDAWLADLHSVGYSFPSIVQYHLHHLLL